jgi:hypothetical protein
VNVDIYWIHDSLFPTVWRNPKVDFFRYIDQQLGHACFAKEPISVGETLLTVPFSACLTGKDEQVLVRVISEAATGACPDWAQYLTFILSSGVLNVVPILWDEKEEISRIPSLSAVCECLYSKLPPTWESAYMLSRSFEFHDGRIASVPFGDMFNHSTERWNTRIREMDDSFQFIAESDIAVDEEILNNYGDWFDAITMFATHGFFEQSMIRETVYIRVDDALCVIDTNCGEEVKGMIQGRTVEPDPEDSTDEFSHPLLSQIAQADRQALLAILNS